MSTCSTEPSLSFFFPVSPPALALAALQRRVAVAEAATAAATLELAPEVSLAKEIADLEADLAAQAAAVAQRGAALEAVTRVSEAAKGRLAAADAKVRSLRAACEALDNDFIMQSASLRGDLTRAVADAGGAWLEAAAATDRKEGE